MGRSSSAPRRRSAMHAVAMRALLATLAGCTFDSGPLAGGPGLEPPGDPTTGVGAGTGGTSAIPGAGGTGSQDGVAGATPTMPPVGPGEMSPRDAGTLDLPDAGSDATMLDSGAPDSGIVSHDAAVSDAGGVGTCLGWTKPAGMCPEVCQYCDPSRGTCTIGCGGITGGCTDKTVECPPGWACIVECNGFNSCNRGGVLCADGPCQVNCTGYNSCNDWTLHCGADACSAECSSFGNGGNLTLEPGKSCNVHGC